MDISFDFVGFAIIILVFVFVILMAGGAVVTMFGASDDDVKTFTEWCVSGDQFVIDSTVYQCEEVFVIERNS